MARIIDGRFELVERLGGGGMGTVWRAVDLQLHREVAVKEVRPPDPNLAEHDPEAAASLRARVLREARAHARIDHRNVVTIYHIVTGSEAEFPWLVMELIRGGSLQDRLEQGPLSPAEAARVGRGVLAGLCAAHAAGIEHRDIKPPNVLFRSDGTPVLTDFGISVVQGSTMLTAAGALIGTPEYMAPERVAGREGGPAADLWSLAMTLYVAVEGHSPFRRENTLAGLAAVLNEPVPPPRQAGPLTSLLNAVLVREPGDRADAAACDRMLTEAEATASGERGRSVPLPSAPTQPAWAPGAAPPEPPAAPVAGRPPLSAPSRRTRFRGKAKVLTSVVAAGVVGALVWVYLPIDDGGKKDEAKNGSSPSAALSPSATPTQSKPDRGELVVGIPGDVPGLGLAKPDGTYEGLMVDVATGVARELGYEAKNIRWKEINGDDDKYVNEVDVDLLIDDRIKSRPSSVLDSGYVAYLPVHRDLLQLADAKPLRDIADLKGKRVCRLESTSRGIEVRVPEAKVRSYPSVKECVAALRRGEVDAINADNAQLAGVGSDKDFRFAGIDELKGMEDAFYVVDPAPDGPLTLEEVTDAVARIKAAGDIARSVYQHLPLWQGEL